MKNVVAKLHLHQNGGLVFLITLLICTLGLGISVYLTGVHYSSLPLVCSNSGIVNCSNVVGSGYGVILGSGIPTSAAGIIWFLILIVIALTRFKKPAKKIIEDIQLLWSVIGLFIVIGLIYLEIVRVGAICIWCSSVHVLVLILFFISLITNPRVKPLIKH